MDELKRREPGRVCARYLWHALAGLWIVVILVLHLANHRDVPELWDAAREGTAPERVEAIRQLVMRADPARLAEEYPAPLLDGDESLLRELAFTNLFTRDPAAEISAADAKLLPKPKQRFRARLWFRCRTTTSERVERADLDRWFAPQRGRRDD